MTNPGGEVMTVYGRVPATTALLCLPGIAGGHAAGSGGVRLATNQFVGSCLDTIPEPMTVALDGAKTKVVPLPVTAWRFMSSVACLTIRRRS